MGYDLYNGESEGFEMLVDGYIDYAKEVISHRSFPDLRDGQKPVGRRVLYMVRKTAKGGGFYKCGTLVGRVMELHPHGDASIYGTMAAMTDGNGSLNVPLLEGNGMFGKVFSSDKPAAMRYTKAKLSANADDFFRDMEACEFIPSEEGEGEEPAVLPVRYPVCLINGTTGMAVSIATDVPSFNFHDVVNLTITGIKEGFENLDFKEDIIVPDFPSGGILVRDDAELAKIMKVGKGKIKVRAKVEIVGKEIHVKEVPYGRTVEGIIKSINKADIYGISGVRNTIGFNSDTLLVITCKSKKLVEDVLITLYRMRILQNTITSNMTFTMDGEPKILGVFDVLDEWVKWRRTVCQKKFKKLLDDIHGELETLSYFIRLISNNEWRDTYVDIVVHKSKKEGENYLRDIFDDITLEVCDWISKRSVSAFNNGGKYRERYDNLCQSKDEYNGYLDDIDGYIVSDLESLLDEKSGMFARKTEITNKDYRFSKIVDEIPEDDSYCCYILKKDGFLCKVRDDREFGVNDSEVYCKVNARANSVLVGFDNYGRVLRVYGVDIPFTGVGGNGTYLPKYFSVDDDLVQSYKYQIMYLTLLDGRKRYLLYKDGFLGVLDTSEFIGKTKVKVAFNGVDTRVKDRLLDVLDEDEMSDYIVVADDHGDSTKFGIIDLATYKERGRRTRTRVLKNKSNKYGEMNCTYYAVMGTMDVYKFMEDPNVYLGKMLPHSGDIIGDLDVFKEGRYFVEYEENNND